MLNTQNPASLQGFAHEVLEEIFYMDAAHVALYFGPWLMTSVCWCRQQEHKNNPNPDQYFHRANKEPCSKLAGFIWLERHLQLQTAHSYKHLLCQVHLTYPLASRFFLMFELNPYEKTLWDCCTIRTLILRESLTEIFRSPKEVFYIPQLLPDVCCETSKCHVVLI